MQPRHLKTFLAVADSLNFTRAASKVHLAQSSVTEQIQALEADLGVALFERMPRGLRLTDAGRRLCDYARELLSLADEARAAVADTAEGASGMLVVGGLETLCATRIPAWLSAFGTKYPAIALQLKVAGSADLRSAVSAGAMDVAFGFGEPPDSVDLQVDIVGHEPLVVIGPPAHPLRGSASLSADDLAGYSFFVTARGCVYRAMFDKMFSGRRPPRIAAEVDSLAAIRSLVTGGGGCAVMPKIAVEDAGLDRLSLPYRDEAPTVPIVMLRHRRRTPSPTLQRFLDVMRGDAHHPHAAPSL